MCGIAGLALKPGARPDPAVLDAMTRALAHRGPDGHGHHVQGNVALSHTRLAIIDLVTGDQPLHAGPASLVGNGILSRETEPPCAECRTCGNERQQRRTNTCC